jgi:Na+/H+-dicarboxylate symporter
MKCISDRAGVDRKIGNFVLPLGATVNMDGTALYESVAVIFIAELMGIQLTLGMQAVIFMTATLAAIGAAAIPGAGLVTMGIVLTAAGLPLDGIGLILAIDRVLDQFRLKSNYVTALSEE